MGIWSRGGAPVEELPDPFAQPVADAGPAPGAPQLQRPRRRRWVLWLYAISAVVLVTLAGLIAVYVTANEVAKRSFFRRARVGDPAP